MMIHEFEHLSKEEQDLLYKAPVMITILIAGADDDIDDAEKATAEKVLNYKRVAGDAELLNYYEEVHKDFEEHLTELLKDYPTLAETRNPIIAKQLEQLNDILPKLHRDFAITYYDNLRSYARKVAEASGGFLGFMSIGPKEQKWVKLQMIKDPKTY